MKARKIISLVLALALVVSLLAACNSGGETGNVSSAAGGNGGSGNVSSNSGGGSNSTGDTGDSSNAGTESKALTVEEIYGEGLSQEDIEAMQNSGNILVYTMSSDLGNGKLDKDPYTAHYLDWAKKYYGLSVKYRFRAWSGVMFEKFMIDYAADDAPDVLTLNYYLWPKIGMRDVLYTTKDLEKKNVIGLDHPVLNANSEACKRYVIGGECYAVTASPQVVIIGVNLDLFEKYNVKSPVDYYKEGTWDLDAYVKCAKEITRTLGNGTKIWGCAGWDYNWTLMANDCYLVSWDNTRTKLVVTMNNSKVERVCNIITDLFSNSYNPKEGGVDAFNKGELGFFSYIPSNLAPMLRDVTFKWDIVPFPYGPDNTTGAYPAEVYAQSVVSTTKNPQGAVNYIISDKLWRKMSTGADFVPKDDYYNQTGYGVFSQKQVDMYTSYQDKATQNLALGVGEIAKNYNFWNDIRDGKKTFKEAVDAYEAFYKEQCDLENAERAKIKK